MKSVNYRKLSTGNYLGRSGNYYVFIFRRPHGGWCVSLSLGKATINTHWAEGYFAKSLPTISKAKQWVKEKIPVS